MKTTPSDGGESQCLADIDMHQSSRKQRILDWRHSPLMTAWRQRKYLWSAYADFQASSRRRHRFQAWVHTMADLVWMPFSLFLPTRLHQHAGGRIRNGRCCLHLHSLCSLVGQVAQLSLGHSVKEYGHWAV